MIDENTAPIGVIGGSGFYEFVDEPTTVDVDTPVRPPERAGRHRAGRRPTRRVHPAARARPPLPAAPGALSRQPLGAAGRRRAAGVGAVRGRVAARRPGAGQPRRPRSARRPHVGSRAHLLRRGGRRRPRQFRRSVLPDRPADRRRGGGVARVDAERRRHVGRDPGAAVLEPGRVATPRRPGLVDRRHDRRSPRPGWPANSRCASPRSPSSPTSMRASRPAKASATPRCSRSSPRACIGFGCCSPASFARCPTSRPARAPTLSTVRRCPSPCRDAAPGGASGRGAGATGAVGCRCARRLRRCATRRRDAAREARTRRARLARHPRRRAPLPPADRGRTARSRRRRASLGSVTPKPAATTPVVTAARDLAAGAVLTTGDLRAVGVPPADVPAGSGDRRARAGRPPAHRARSAAASR